MTLRALAVMLGVAVVPVGARAEVTGLPRVPLVATERAVALSDLLMIGPAIEVMRQEGLVSAGATAEEMFPGAGRARWQASLTVIYDPATMRGRFDIAFAVALAESAQIEAIGAFFGSDLGQRVLTLEIEARRALLDPAAETAAKRAYAEIAATGNARVAALEAFVVSNDLIELNVMGALNANLAFLGGMADEHSFAEAMPEDQILAQVWASEPDVRNQTVDWHFPYLALAYKPLSDAELRAYQAFSDSAAGQAANTALFAAFDAMFVAMSRDLGRAAARQMQGQEL